MIDLIEYLSIFLSWFFNPDKAQESNTILYMQDAIKNQSTDILTGFYFFNNYLIYTQQYGISHSKLFLSCIWIITYIWSSMISLVFPTKIPIFRRKNPYESCCELPKDRINSIKLNDALCIIIRNISWICIQAFIKETNNN